MWKCTRVSPDKRERNGQCKGRTTTSEDVRLPSSSSQLQLLSDVTLPLPLLLPPLS